MGYQITPSFSIGLEHKVTFPIHDRLDGFVRSSGSQFQNDRNHYTALNFRWNLFRGRYNGGTTPGGTTTGGTTPGGNNGGTTTTTPIGNPVGTPTSTVNRPVVNIINPPHSPHIVHNPQFTIKANIYYVDGPQNIVFTQNGLIKYEFLLQCKHQTFRE